MLTSENSPWMLSASDLLKDAVFFVPIGTICGIIQVVGYRYFKAEWGAELLFEHIAFNSLLLITVLLWLIKALLHWLSSRMETSWAEVLVAHISKRAIGIASISASVIVGFGLAAAFHGAYYFAFAFLLLSLYFVALAEIAANPLFGSGRSRTCLTAFAIIIAMPFSAHLLV